MKKWLCLLGTVICFLSCTFVVRADVIWLPMDSFYEENASGCTHVNRIFTANGPDGVVILYESPKSPKVITTWENGFQACISFTYEDEDGILWGIYDNHKQTGWMPMEYMELVYDHISFVEDYGEEIVGQKGSLGEQYQGKSIFQWKYPGSKEHYSLTLHDPLEYNQVYVDEKGHSWGYVGYYYGGRNIWVCIDQPEAEYEQLYPDGAPQIGKAAEEVKTEYRDAQMQEAKRIVPKANQGTIAILAVLVALVVLVTAVLLVVLKKGKATENSNP